jgi:hypothetical protein
VRAGIAVEEVLDKLPVHSHARAARRWPWIAAGAAVIALTIAYGIVERTRLPNVEPVRGEPLRLKLEFAFPAAGR